MLSLRYVQPMLLSNGSASSPNVLSYKSRNETQEGNKVQINKQVGDSYFDSIIISVSYKQQVAATQ